LGLFKVFGSIHALYGLSFQINQGEILGLIGPNGAGRTMALRMISTLLLPTSGSVKVFGFDVIEKASEIRRIITYLPDDAGAYPNLSGLEYLEFMAKFSASGKSDVQRMVGEVEISGLRERLRVRAKTYSKGMRAQPLHPLSLVPPVQCAMQLLRPLR